MCQQIGCNRIPMLIIIAIGVLIIATEINHHITIKINPAGYSHDLMLVQSTTYEDSDARSWYVGQ